MEIEDHPSALRNRQPIFEVLSNLLQANARVLEVASGNGTHGAYCTAAMPALHWQVSEADPEKLKVLQARYEQQPTKQGIQAPIALDALTFDWSSQQVDALLAINLVHISPLRVTQALMWGASQTLTRDGLLLLYGPYRVNGEHTSDGNAAFDLNLRERNASWGIRDVEQLEALAVPLGFTRQQTLDMPANNKFLVFARES